MTRHLRSLQIVVLLLSAIAVISAQGPGDPRLSARAAFRQVQPEIAKRFAGVILTSLSTNDVDGQGNAAWALEYYSSSPERFVSVAIHERTMSFLQLNYGGKSALPIEWLDSKEALERAKAVGLKGGTTFMNLMVDGKHKIAAWSVGTTGQRIILNAVTGALLEIVSR